MEKRALKESFSIKYSEMDCNLVLKPAVLLQFLQDLASDNAEQLGFGYSYIIKKNLAWFLLKYRMEFEDYPSKIDNIQIETEPRGYNKLFAFRNFKILNGEKLLGKVSIHPLFFYCKHLSTEQTYLTFHIYLLFLVFLAYIK